MDRRSFLAAAASGVAAGIAGCTGLFGASLSESEYDVGMRAAAFVPAETSVTVGDTLVWGNNNDRPHTVTAYENGIPGDATFFASGGFDSEAAARDGYETDFSGAIDPGDTYEHTFEVPGTYSYFCIPHEAGGMVGTVEVREETPSAGYASASSTFAEASSSSYTSSGCASRVAFWTSTRRRG